MNRCGAVMLTVLLAVPALVQAGEQPPAAGGSEFSLAGALIQMVAALALVLGIILLFYYVSNRWLRPHGAARGAERHIRLVETRYLAPKKSLVLVEVGGEFLLLGSSGDNLSFIKQIDILEEIEVVEEEDGLPRASRFQGKLEAVAARLTALRTSRADNCGRKTG